MHAKDKIRIPRLFKSLDIDLTDQRHVSGFLFFWVARILFIYSAYFVYFVLTGLPLGLLLFALPHSPSRSIRDPPAIGREKKTPKMLTMRTCLPAFWYCCVGNSR